MTSTRTAVAILAAGLWLSMPALSSAQIASYVDQHGKVIFINGDSPAAKSRSTISSSSTGSRTPSASVAELPSSSASPASASTASASALSLASQPDDRLDRIVRQAAERHKVDPALVKAVISTESSWNPRAVSRKGAVGLMQLIPETAQRYGVGNRFDPAQNVEGGTMYLRSLLDRYNGDLTKSLAAYNAGERAVDLSGGVPQYPETQDYVRKVTNAYFQPGSGRNEGLWSPPRAPVRKEVDSSGRIVFTNE
jgi:soluble lytic murein transglycosylase-like protein